MCPMAYSSQKGELGMCKCGCTENGAAADITKANNRGKLMHMACKNGHLEVCKGYGTWRSRGRH